MPALDLRTTWSHGLAHDSTTIPADLIAAASICLFLTTSAVCARIFTKTFDLHRTQIDDYAIIFAGAIFIVFTGTFFAGARTGLGGHIEDLSAKAIKNAYLYSNVLDILYAPIMFAAKFAILVQIDRLFSGIRSKIVYWAVRTLILVNALCYTAIFFVQVFACTPRAKISNPDLPGKCISQTGAIAATGVVNIISDIAILIFAVLGMSRVQLSGRRQTLVSLVFCAGSFACVASACRLVWGVRGGNRKGFSNIIYAVHMWSLAELTSIIYIACCPTFPRLVQYFHGTKSVKLSHQPPSPAYSKWTSSTAEPVGTTRNTLSSSKPASRIGTTPNASKSQIMLVPSEPTHVFIPMPGRALPKRQKSHKRIPSRDLPRSMFSLGRSASKFSRSTSKRSKYAPSERPISHLSYESRSSTYSTDDIPVTPLSPMSLTSSATPTSPARTEFSVGNVQDVVRMKIMPVYFSRIKKTTDVRVSTHTNPGSPLKLGKSDQW